MLNSVADVFEVCADYLDELTDLCQPAWMLALGSDFDTILRQGDILNYLVFEHGESAEAL
jgi:hypothetical protein